MRALVAVVAAWPLAAAVVPGVRVSSEFVSSGGREVLSPAVPRNGWSSFHVTVEAPSGTPFTLHIAQNPDNFARAELYREGRRVMLPIDGEIPGGASAVTFWLDVFIHSDAEIRRFKLEPQLYVASAGWIVYPMEFRVVDSRVPGAPSGDLFPSFPNPRHFALNRLCGGNRPLSRNLEQDLRLANDLADDAVAARLKSALEVRDAAPWCANPVFPANPEWYLGFRDFLLGQAKYRPLIK